MTSLNPAHRIALAHMGHGSPFVYREKSFQAAKISGTLKPLARRTSVQRRMAVISPCIVGSAAVQYVYACDKE